MNRALDYAETAWAAGLFEGEGCISFESRWKKLTLSISMTDEDVVKRFVEWAGYGNVREHNTPTMRRNNQKVQWLWQTQGNTAELIIERMLPFLGMRRTARYEEVINLVHRPEKK